MFLFILETKKPNVYSCKIHKVRSNMTRTIQICHWTQSAKCLKCLSLINSLIYLFIFTRHSVILKLYFQKLKFGIYFSLNWSSFVSSCSNYFNTWLCHNLAYKFTIIYKASCSAMLLYAVFRLAFLLPDQCGLNQVQVNRSRCSIYWALTSVQKSWEINSNTLITQIVW